MIENVSVYQEIDKESDGMFGDTIKEKDMSESLQTKSKFCAILKEVVSKTEISKDFDKLDAVCWLERKLLLF